MKSLRLDYFRPAVYEKLCESNLELAKVYHDTSVDHQKKEYEGQSESQLLRTILATWAGIYAVIALLLFALS